MAKAAKKGDELCPTCGYRPGENGLETHDENKFLTYTDAADQIGKNRNTIARWVNDGLMEFHTYPTGQRAVRQNQINGILRASSIDKQVVGELMPEDTRTDHEARVIE